MIESVLNNRWQLKDSPSRLIDLYRSKYDLDEIEARILAGRDVEEDEVENFLNPKLRHLLPDPFHLKDMDKAVKLASDAVKEGRKICIFGDYDVDGATSSALLKRVFRSLGNESTIYIPDRMKEGYGPNSEAMKKLSADGVNLVITVDCGSMSHDAISSAKNLGMEVIIIDHHICSDALPVADAIVNPNRLDEDSKYNYLAAVGVSFLFAVALVSKMKKQKFFESKAIQEPDLLQLLDIVALGTVCDVMPLKGLNRAFVKQGLKIMSRRGNIGLKALADRAGIDQAPTGYHLGYVLGPRINAGGRVGESYIGSKLLSCEDEIEAAELAEKLEQFNMQRREIESSIIDYALTMALEQKDDHCIMVSGNWHPGVIGVVAGKLKEMYERPVIVASVIDGIAKASCRSIRGIDFGSTLAEAKLQGIVEEGGGHAMAAGFTAKEEKLDELKSFLDKAFEKHQDKIHEGKVKEYEIEITSSGLSIELHNKIHKIAPFGAGNPEPVVRVDNLYVLKAHIVGEKHISLMLSPDNSGFKGKTLYAIAFNSMGTPLEDVLFDSVPHTISAIGKIKPYHRNGVIHPQLIIDDLIIG